MAFFRFCPIFSVGGRPRLSNHLGSQRHSSTIFCGPQSRPQYLDFDPHLRTFSNKSTCLQTKQDWNRPAAQKLRKCLQNSFLILNPDFWTKYSPFPMKSNIGSPKTKNSHKGLQSAAGTSTIFNSLYNRFLPWASYSAQNGYLWPSNRYNKVWQPLTFWIWASTGQN